MRFLREPTFWGGVAAGFFVGPIVVRVVTMQLARLRASQSNGG